MTSRREPTNQPQLCRQTTATAANQHRHTHTHSQVCREKCFLSEGAEFPGGGATAEEGGWRVMVGGAVTTAGGSAPWASRCWMECSWKQGSASSTVAARDILQGETASAGSAGGANVWHDEQ